MLRLEIIINFSGYNDLKSKCFVILAIKYHLDIINILCLHEWLYLQYNYTRFNKCK